MDYKEWHQKNPNCTRVYIYAEKLDSYFKEVYDFLKYKSIEIISIVSKEGEMYNGHFEDTSIMPEASSKSLDYRDVPIIAIGTKISGWISTFHNASFFEERIVELCNVSDGYEDDYGNIIINESGKSIDKVIMVGAGCKIHIGKNVTVPFHMRLEVHSNSEIHIGENVELREDTAFVAYADSCLSIGDYSIIGRGSNLSARYDSLIQIGCECIIRDEAYFFDKYKSNIVIGDRSTFEKRTTMISVMESNIHIGNNFMGSFDVSIIGNDGHGVYSLEDKRIYNVKSDILIGDNVWVGIKSSILSGAVVPNGVIIGAGSVVTKGLQIEENCAVAGNPAKMVKENVGWSRYI